VTGLGASQIAIVKIPTGATYLELSLECTIAGAAATRAQLEAMLPQIRCTVSGIEKWTLSATQLIAIIEFYQTGLIGDSGFLTIPFERLFMDGGLAGMLNPAFGTLGESSWQLEITQSAGSTIDAITAWAQVSPIAEALGAHMKTVRLTPTFASTGKFFYADLPKELGTYLYALHFQVPVVANLVNIAYIADEVRVIDCKPALLNQLYTLGKRPRTVQSAKLFVHLDFCRRSLDADAIRLDMNSQVLELDFANAAPNSFTVLAEIGTAQPTQAGAQ
jgi:hypothetical protein